MFTQPGVDEKKLRKLFLTSACSKSDNLEPKIAALFLLYSDCFATLAMTQKNARKDKSDPRVDNGMLFVYTDGSGELNITERR